MATITDEDEIVEFTEKPEIPTGKVLSELWRSKPLAWFMKIFITYIYLAILPVIVIVLYMWENKFFSYDFFTEGFIPLGIFHHVTILFIILFSFLSFSFLIPLTFLGNTIYNNLVKPQTLKYHEKRIQIVFAIIFLCISLPANIYVLLYINKLSPVYTMFTLLGFFIIIHISSFVFLPSKANLVTILLLVIVTFLVCITQREQVAKALGFSLSYFGVGGGIGVVVLSKLEEEETKHCVGTLLMMSPNNIFLRTYCRHQNLVLPRSKFQAVTYDINSDKPCDSEIDIVENVNEIKIKIDDFKSRVEDNADKFLIVGVSNECWIIAGLDNNGEFKQAELNNKNDPDSILRNELEKGDIERDKQKICGMAKQCVLMPSSSCTP